MRESEVSIIRIPIALTWSARKARIDQASIRDDNFLEEWAKLDMEMRIHERGLMCMQLAAMFPHHYQVSRKLDAAIVLVIVLYLIETL